MTRLWWVRHGPTHRKDMIGWTDAPCDLGNREQIGRLSAYLPKGAKVISSDLSRAVDTADAICGDRTRLPHDPDLREIHFGDWETRTYKQVQKSHPDLSRAYWETPGDTRPPGGESWNDLRRRVDRAVSRLEEFGEDLIVVAHFGAILSRVQQARACSAYDVLSQKVSNLSVTRIDKGNTGWLEIVCNHHP